MQQSTNSRIHHMHQKMPKVPQPPPTRSPVKNLWVSPPFFARSGLDLLNFSTVISSYKYSLALFRRTYFPVLSNQYPRTWRRVENLDSLYFLRLLLRSSSPLPPTFYSPPQLRFSSSHSPIHSTQQRHPQNDDILLRNYLIIPNPDNQLPNPVNLTIHYPPSTTHNISPKCMQT
jgi:hypothetical protein